MTIALRGAAAAAVALFAVPALAQTPAPAAPARPAATPLTGPVIAGVCTYNNAGAITTSTVGRFVSTRLQALETEVENELRTDRTAIETENRALETGRATIAPQLFQQRVTALSTRAEAFQRKAAVRQREMQATQQKALQRIGQDLDPIIRQVYAARGCGLLLDSQAVVAANPALDVTQQVVTALNGRLTTFTINRERLPDTPPPAAGAAGPAAPRPAGTPQTPPATRQ